MPEATYPRQRISTAAPAAARPSRRREDASRPATPSARASARAVATVGHRAPVLHLVHVRPVEAGARREVDVGPAARRAQRARARCASASATAPPSCHTDSTGRSRARGDPLGDGETRVGVAGRRSRARWPRESSVRRASSVQVIPRWRRRRGRRFVTAGRGRMRGMRRSPCGRTSDACRSQGDSDRDRPCRSERQLVHRLEVHERRSACTSSSPRATRRRCVPRTVRLSMRRSSAGRALGRGCIAQRRRRDAHQDGAVARAAGWAGDTASPAMRLRLVVVPGGGCSGAGRWHTAAGR